MEAKKIDARENVKVVTHNSFLEACGLEKISLKARKLLYIAIAQCRKSDREFFEYEISVPEFAALMDIDPSNVYGEADRITDELMRGFIKYNPEGKKRFEKYSLFSFCKYTDQSIIHFKLNEDMTDFLLQIGRNFTQPLLHDFLKMKSPYSMEIWHVMQREMKSQKVGVTDMKEFDLTLEELRRVTGCTDKFKQVGQFKEKVLDKAIREISNNCAVNITYKNLKRGKRVTGFRFYAISWIHIDPDKISPETFEKVNAFKRKQAEKGQTISLTDQIEGQYSLDDYLPVEKQP